MDNIEGEKDMSTTADDSSETNASPEVKAQSGKKTTAPNAVNKYAQARLAKKKQRRKAHRLTIKRSNTGG
jgi:hypothetical protein